MYKESLYKTCQKWQIFFIPSRPPFIHPEMSKISQIWPKLANQRGSHFDFRLSHPDSCPEDVFLDFNIAEVGKQLDPNDGVGIEHLTVTIWSRAGLDKVSP